MPGAQFLLGRIRFRCAGFCAVRLAAGWVQNPILMARAQPLSLDGREKRISLFDKNENQESEDLMADTGQGTRDMEQLTTDAETLSARGKEAAARLANAMETARTRVQESTVASAKATDRAIREYPYQSLGIAFGAGVLIGCLIARR